MSSRHSAVVGALLCFAAGAANAQVLASNEGANRGDFPSDNRLRVEVRGRIEPQCGVTFSADQLDLGTLNDSNHGGTTAGAHSLPFHIECNQPFTFSLTADNGVLRNDTLVAGDERFRREVEYRANIGGNGARARQSECDGAALSQGDGCRFAVRAASTRGSGALEISWDQDPRPLLQGEYHDRLRIVVQPNLTGEE